MTIALKESKKVSQSRQEQPAVDNANTFFGKTTNHFFGGQTARNNMIQRAPAVDYMAWDKFTKGFNSEFKSILHVFGTPLNPSDKMIGVDQQSGTGLDMSTLKQLFTVKQRDQLNNFFATKKIPDRLFNGDEIGNTTAQQRLMIAARILSVGTYYPGSFEQRVHARMCFHWLNIVHHYAGVTSGPLNKGIMGNFDHAGNLVFGMGDNKDVFMGSKVPASELPATQQGDVGPIPTDSKQKEAMDKADPGKADKFHRRRTLPFEELDKIQPGDWIWYYNANASDSGSHSVIFSRWASGTQTVKDIRYRTAIAFSQPHPEDGGKEHPMRLGEQYYNEGDFKYPPITPVTYISRVAASAHNARTVEELLPMIKNKDILDSKNKVFLEQAAKTATTNKHINVPMLKAMLQTENTGIISYLHSHLSSGQRALLAEANKSTDLETLVRLTEKLRTFKHNTAIYEANMKDTYESKDGVNKRWTTADAAYKVKETKMQEDTAKLQTKEDDIIRKIADATTEISHIDLQPEINELTKKAKTLRKERDLLKGADRKLKQTSIDELTKQIDELQKKANKADPTLKTLRAQLTRLNALKEQLEENKKDLTRQLAKEKDKLPFGMVTPGNLRKEDSHDPTGLVEKVYSVKEIEHLAM
jgi:hypothetical protein